MTTLARVRARGADGVDGASATTLSGTSTGEAVGISVDWVDLDGDGFDDAVVGAHLSEPGTTPNNAGAVYVIAGPTTTSVTVDTQPYLGGGAVGDWLGWSTSGGSDVDGDGSISFSEVRIRARSATARAMSCAH